MKYNVDNKLFEISRLLHKQLQEVPLTDEEKMLLNRWLEKDRGNKLQYEELSDPQCLARELKRYDSTDTLRQLELVRDKVRRKTKVRKLYSFWAKVAVLAISLSFLYVFMQYKEDLGFKDVATLAKQDIDAGFNQATLNLSNGSKLVLDGEKGGVLSEGMALRYEDGGVIDELEENTYATLETPRAGQYRVTLSDGTKVLLNAATQLKYPVRFVDNIREVQLDGEAYFEVSHQAEKPFIIRTAQQEIKVLGTTLAVRAYEEEEFTTLVNGKVEVHAVQTAGRHLLQPGKQAFVSASGSRVREVDMEEYLGWVNGRMVGMPISLRGLIPDLERWYDISFRDSDLPSLEDKAYISIDRNEKLSTVLKALETTYEVEFQIKGREVKISKKK